MQREFPLAPLVGVGAVIVDSGRVLLVRRGTEPMKGRWSLPGGLLEIGEPLADGVIREVQEETGLEVVIERMLELGYDETNQVIVILYQGRAVGGTLAAADDVDEARWFGRDDLPELAFQSTRRAVAAWLSAPQ